MSVKCISNCVLFNVRYEVTRRPVGYINYIQKWRGWLTQIMCSVLVIDTLLYHKPFHKK